MLKKHCDLLRENVRKQVNFRDLNYFRKQLITVLLNMSL